MTVNEDLLQTYELNKIPVYRLYEPEGITIVLGAGRRNQDDLHKDEVHRDDIPVKIRKGGGGTVVLSPGMLVLALVTDVTEPYRNREHARSLNLWFAEVLGNLGISGIEVRGISDLTIRDRKILGSSLYRRRSILFYQASLLVCNDLRLFSRYLSYPSTVPDYRQARRHEEFCTTLHNEGYDLSVEDIRHRFDPEIRRQLPGFPG